MNNKISISYVTSDNRTITLSERPSTAETDCELSPQEQERFKLEIKTFWALTATVVCYLILIILQWIANVNSAKAVIAAQRAIEAAQQANRLAQQNSYDSRLPWIAIEFVSTGIDKWGNFTIDLTVTNTAESPALFLGIEAMVNVHDHEHCSGGTGIVGTLMPHTPKTVTVTLLSAFDGNTQAIENAMQAPTQQIKLICRYKDVYHRDCMYAAFLSQRDNKWTVIGNDVFIDISNLNNIDVFNAANKMSENE